MQGNRPEIISQIALIFFVVALFEWIRFIMLAPQLVRGAHESGLYVGERRNAPRSQRSEADRATASQLVRVDVMGAKPRLTDYSARRMGAIPGAGSALPAEKRSHGGDGPVLGGRGAKGHRVGWRGGACHGGNRQGLRRFRAPLVSVLALLLPASALLPAQALAASGKERVAAHARLSAGQFDRATLALGSGYNTPEGSAAVRVLQRRLVLAGDSPGPIDGLYGPLTMSAVIRFQASRGLAVDGIVGHQTWGLTRSIVLSPGLRGHDPAELVRKLQRRLAAAALRAWAHRRGGASGAVTAARPFGASRTARGLPADGTASSRTRAAAVSADARRPSRVATHNAIHAHQRRMGLRRPMASPFVSIAALAAPHGTPGGP